LGLTIAPIPAGVSRRIERITIRDSYPVF